MQCLVREAHGRGFAIEAAPPHSGHGMKLRSATGASSGGSAVKISRLRCSARSASPHCDLAEAGAARAGAVRVVEVKSRGSRSRRRRAADRAGVLRAVGVVVPIAGLDVGDDDAAA